MVTRSGGDDATVGQSGRNDVKRGRVRLRAHTTSPQRTVFIEPDNSDGWISTGVTAEVRR